METAKGITDEMEKLKKSFPKDVDYVVPFESVSVVKVSIEEVLHTLVIALLLVIIVVFLFLQSWRATLIPILAIPVSIIGTFAFFIPLGFTVNTLTLFGLVLAIGIVVDDAIVVVEAVQHYIDHEGISGKGSYNQSNEGYIRSCCCHCIDTRCCVCTCWFYTRHCRKIIPTVCHYHCRIGVDLSVRSIVVNACIVFIVFKNQ